MNNGVGFNSTLLVRSDNSRDVTSADFNNDGWIDALVVNYGQANELLLNTGAGRFVSTLLERADNSYAVTSADFNDDGFADALVLNYLQANEHLRFEVCLDGYSQHPDVRLGCFACPRHTTDTRASTQMCELCPPGRLGPAPGLTHDQRFFCIPCEAGTSRDLVDAECSMCPTGRYASAGAPSCEPCVYPQVTELEGAGSTRCRQCPPGQGPNSAGSACEDCAGSNILSSVCAKTVHHPILCLVIGLRAEPRHALLARRVRKGQLALCLPIALNALQDP